MKDKPGLQNLIFLIESRNMLLDGYFSYTEKFILWSWNTERKSLTPTVVNIYLNEHAWCRGRKLSPSSLPDSLADLNN